MPMNDPVAATLGPIVALLAAGVVAAGASRALRISPIIGYLLLGLLMRVMGVGLFFGGGAGAALAQLGVVFLLFDLGLHLSLKTIRERSADIFGFGSVQILAAAAPLAGIAVLIGIPPAGACILGCTLALSSTAVVTALIAERHQKSCPVGLTSTAILVFQDLAGIVVLVLAHGLESGAPFAAVTESVAKAAAAFVVTVAIARYVARPVFDLVARASADEVFTAAALSFAVAAAWASGMVGLSLTLGGFLGGVALAETTYRATIAAEVKPFRSLLTSFFFISVGASIDPSALRRDWLGVLAAAVAFLLIKGMANMVASLVFRWSLAGSVQLGFLLAQGSEFTFVILGLPKVRSLIGNEVSSFVVSVVAVTLLGAPATAAAGRRVAGEMRRRRERPYDRELVPRGDIVPVLIVGMGRRGRAVADALISFDVKYIAIERNPQRLREAVADGYAAVFGDMADFKFWETIDVQARSLSVVSSPVFEESEALTEYVRRTHPDLPRIASVKDPSEADRFAGIGMTPVIDDGAVPGLQLAAYVLRELNIENDKIERWLEQRSAREDDLETAGR